MKQKLLLFLLLLTSLATYAYDFESNGIYYDIISRYEKTAEVTYLEQWTETPSYIGGYSRLPHVRDVGCCFFM
jgi:hypothetical protein